MGSPPRYTHSQRSISSLTILVCIYTIVYLMVSEWDPEKSDANRQERGFDFEFATVVFESLTLEMEDLRKDYQERRIVAIGVADGLHLTVVYTDRRQEGGDHVRRIISARRSNRRERKAYRKAISG